MLLEALREFMKRAFCLSNDAYVKLAKKLGKYLMDLSKVLSFRELAEKTSTLLRELATLLREEVYVAGVTDRRVRAFLADTSPHGGRVDWLTDLLNEIVVFAHTHPASTVVPSEDDIVALTVLGAQKPIWWFAVCRRRRITVARCLVITVPGGNTVSGDYTSLSDAILDAIWAAQRERKKYEGDMEWVEIEGVVRPLYPDWVAVAIEQTFIDHVRRRLPQRLQDYVRVLDIEVTGEWRPREPALVPIDMRARGSGRMGEVAEQ